MATSKYERIQQRLNGLETRDTDSEVVKKTIDIIKTYTGNRMSAIKQRANTERDSGDYKYYHDRCDCLIALLDQIAAARRVNHDETFYIYLLKCAKKSELCDFPYLGRKRSTLYPALQTLSSNIGNSVIPLREATNGRGQTTTQLTQECEELRRRNEVLTRENATLRLENEKLQGQVEGLNEKVAELEGEITSQNEKISDLTDSDTTLKKQVRELLDDKEERDESFSKLQADVQLLMQSRASSSPQAGPSYESATRKINKQDSECNVQSSYSPDSTYRESTPIPLSVGSGSSS